MMEPFRRVMRYGSGAYSTPELCGSPSWSARAFRYTEVGLDRAKRDVSTSPVTQLVRTHTGTNRRWVNLHYPSNMVTSS